MVWLQNANSMPPQTFSTAELYGTSCHDHLAVDAGLLVDPDVNVELILFIQTVNSKQRLSATKASELMLTLAAGQLPCDPFQLYINNSIEE